LPFSKELVTLCRKKTTSQNKVRYIDSTRSINLIHMGILFCLLRNSIRPICCMLNGHHIPGIGLCSIWKHIGYIAITMGKDPGSANLQCHISRDLEASCMHAWQDRER
jgi:hypothetical protein